MLGIFINSSSHNFHPEFVIQTKERKQKRCTRNMINLSGHLKELIYILVIVILLHVDYTLFYTIVFLVVVVISVISNCYMSTLLFYC